MSILHRWLTPGHPELPVGKVVCVGRNYAAHALELGHAVPQRPILFMKPASAVVPLESPIDWPRAEGCCHFETELTLLIHRPLSHATPTEIRQAVAGLGIGLDLTLRDLQEQLKQAGHPWERAKAFDGAAPLSAFIPAEELSPWEPLQFSLDINGKRRQTGNTALMLFSFEKLLMEISQCFRLEPGDVVMTGTPQGVGPLDSGDALLLTLDNRQFKTSVR